MDRPVSRHERLQQRAEEHARAAEAVRAEREIAARSRKRKWVAVGVVSVLVIVALGARVVLAPGQYDGFAKCLTGNGVVMYGAIEWCSYTKAQANMFGKSFKFVDYRDHTELDGIQKTPTWVIKGERYPGVQGFDRLAALTGCEY
jgi:hypothetical protein